MEEAKRKTISGEAHRELKRKLREHTTGYIVGGLGLVASLAWNEAIKTLIEYIFPLSQNTFFAKLVYAIVVTIIVVVITVYLLRNDRREETL